VTQNSSTCTVQYSTVQYNTITNITAVQLAWHTAQYSVASKYRVKIKAKHSKICSTRSQYYSNLQFLLHLLARSHLSTAHYSQYSNGANRHQHQWRYDQYPSTSRWVTSHAHNSPRRKENLCQTTTQVSKRETGSLPVEREWRALDFVTLNYSRYFSSHKYSRGVLYAPAFYQKNFLPLV
jgi:hypothetical protein